MIGIRCKKLLSNTDTKTCEICIAYLDEQLVCQRCNRICTRINRERHYRSYSCRVSIFITTD